MARKTFRRRNITAALAFGLLLTGQISAAADSGRRAEIWLGVHSWAALSDLNPEAGGSFDDVGFAIGGGIHWPVKRFTNSTLLIGVDGALMSTGSSIPGITDELISRQLYLAPSVRWHFGDAEQYSLDAGVGFHLLDLAEVSSYGSATLEVEHWEETAVIPYIGASWDVPRKQKKATRFSLGVKVHFADFGVVQDEDPLLPPTLGPDAGELSGPSIVLHAGVSWR